MSLHLNRRHSFWSYFLKIWYLKLKKKKTWYGIPYLNNIDQKYTEIYLKTNIQVLVLPATLNRHKRPLQMNLYQVVRIALEAEVLRERATMLRYP